MMNNEGRKTGLDDFSTFDEKPETFTGNHALAQNEPLVFEIGSADLSGVDIEESDIKQNKLNNLIRKDIAGLPGLSEPEAMRHYLRLSQMNYGVDTGMFPLGSCTMKHNPRLNERIARLSGFSDIHPLQPVETVQGALQAMDMLAHYLMELTGTVSIALSPKAGAHGELCGMMAIKAAIEAKGEQKTRTVVLTPESAHGTNPATAAMVGFSIRPIPTRPDGKITAEDVRALLGDDIAGIMLTNPNTCGLFESEIEAIADAVHEAGGYFYCDGANFNAIAGKVKPGDLGVDAMHFNLHKSFSTPHGGGGPGSGPVVFSSRLAPFVPVPFIRKTKGGQMELVEHKEGEAFGRMTAFHGQFAVMIKALTYLLSHGSDGIRQASEDAVLNANYIRVGLQDLYSSPFGERICMHEVLFDDQNLKDTGVTTLDIAKAMIDEGYHPMTMYFPLVAHGAMLIEPTESESKASLDLFIATMRDLAMASKRNDTSRLTRAPYYAPRRRLDETLAARKPVLKWQKPLHKY